jgi:simple sugar transport system permease protein
VNVDLLLVVQSASPALDGATAVGIATGFGAAAVRVATPLLLAATGELVAERSGVINLGVEGAMLAGALAAAIGAVQGGGTTAGLAAALVAGVAASSLFAALAIGARANQIISGTALTLAMTGVTGVVARKAFGTAGAGLSVPTLAPIEVPVLGQIPILGPVLLAQPATTWLAYALVPLVWWLLFRTRWGLALRASGDGAVQARAMGVPVAHWRLAATLFGGACAGLAGATLVLAQVGTFAERMTAGRGFVAIAIVVLGRWHPVGVLAASLLFGALTALQYVFQAAGWDVPYQLFLMLPSVLTLVALAGVVGRTRAPKDLGEAEP